MVVMTKSEFNLRPSVATGLAATEDVIITERGVPAYRLSRLKSSRDPWRVLADAGVVTLPASPRGRVVPRITLGGSRLGELLDEDRADRW